MSETMTIQDVLAMIAKRVSTTTSQSPQYKCAACQDTGWIWWKDEEGRGFSRRCECVKAREAERMIRESGLSRAIEEQKFENFKTDTEIQKKLFNTAKQYVDRIINTDERPWLFIGGNPGAGKTHICTAVCGELLRANKAVRYMQWVDEARKLKAYVNEPDFENLVADYMDCEILYIDDLFKAKYSAFNPSDADIKIAFTVINARYIRGLPTIITCEWDLFTDLLPADEGLFSRVYEKSKGYTIRIPRSKENNYRLRGVMP